MPAALDAALADIQTRFPKGKSVFAQAADGTACTPGICRARPARRSSSTSAATRKTFPGCSAKRTRRRASAGCSSTIAATARAKARPPKRRWSPTRCSGTTTRALPGANRSDLRLRPQPGQRRRGALAAERPVAGVILVTPFDSLAAVAKRHYPVPAGGPAAQAPLRFDRARAEDHGAAAVPGRRARRGHPAGACRAPVRRLGRAEAMGRCSQEAGHNTTDAHPAVLAGDPRISCAIS